MFNPNEKMKTLSRTHLSLAAIVAGLALLGGQAQANVGLTGVWVDDTGKGAIEISECGTNLCGRIVWLKDQTNTKGEPLTDKLNERASQRDRHICGLQVIGDLARQPNGSWDAGWIYDPKQGKSFDVAIEMTNPDRLRVTGYLGTKLFSRTLIWTRAPAELGRCTSARQAAIKPVR